MSTTKIKDYTKDSEIGDSKYLSKATTALFMTFAVSILMLLPELAEANTSPIATTICQVVGQLTGPIGRGVAAIAIVFVGFSLFLGKISWGLALAIGIGVGAIFGSGQIVNMLGGANAAAVGDCA